MLYIRNKICSGNAAGNFSRVNDTTRSSRLANRSILSSAVMLVSLVNRSSRRRLLRKDSANQVAPFGARSVQLINGGFVFVKVVLFTRKFSLGNNSSRVPFVLKR